MKMLISIFLLYLLNQSEIDIAGHWVWCKDIYADGLVANRNHCPKFKFYSDGKGNLDNFTWKLNKRSQLSFLKRKK